MNYAPDKHPRRSLRLSGYDYAQAGAYFVTAGAFGRMCAFGDVVSGEMRLNDAGRIVLACWQDLANHYGHIELDEFVVMPNHIHGIILLTGVSTADARAGLKPAPTRQQPLSEVVRGFKTFSARRINRLRDTPGQPVWQRNYYERIIRNEKMLDAVREYITNNPAKWAEDKENPQNWPPPSRGPRS